MDRAWARLGVKIPYAMIVLGEGLRAVRSATCLPTRHLFLPTNSRDAHRRHERPGRARWWEARHWHWAAGLVAYGDPQGSKVGSAS